MSYENAPATKILATRCAFCRRPLLDAKSVETGVGPICRKKHGYRDLDGMDEATRSRANKLIHDCAVTEDPEVVAAAIGELMLLECDKIADRLAKRIGAVKVTQDDDGALIVRSAYSATFVAATRGLPGRRWDAANKATRFHASAWSALSTAIADCYSGILRFEAPSGLPAFFRLDDLAKVPVKAETVAPAPAPAPVKVEHAGQRVEDLDGDTEYGPESQRAAALALIAQLEAAGFARVTDSRLLPWGCREEVWERAVVSRADKPEVGHFVRVFTTIESGAMRASAKDSIKVVGGRRYWTRRSGTWKLGFFKLSNERRVHRTGTIEGIVNRTVARCRDAWIVCRDDHRAYEAKK
jgi:hypothetical protein